MNKQVRHFNRERLKQEAALGIFAIMESEGISRTELARLVGKSKPFVSKVLGGSHNFQLETLADLYAVLGRAVHFTLGADVQEFRLPVDECGLKQGVILDESQTGAASMSFQVDFSHASVPILATESAA